MNSQNCVSDFKNVRDMVRYILKNYKETRSNDTKLFIKVCEMHNLKTCKDIYNSDISIITIHKARQIIQNKEKLFLPDECVYEERQKMSKILKNYYGKNNISIEIKK